MAGYKPYELSINSEDRRSECRYIVLHCSANTVADSKSLDVAFIAKVHIGARFDRVGYHYIILENGRIQKGVYDAENGQQTAGLNTVSLGVCYIGGYGVKEGDNKDTRTIEQKRSMLVLVYLLKRKYPGAMIIGHCDVPGSGKTCPNFNAVREYDWINKGGVPTAEHEQLFKSAGVKDWRLPYSLKNIEDWGFGKLKTDTPYSRTALGKQLPPGSTLLSNPLSTIQASKEAGSWGNNLKDVSADMTARLLNDGRMVKKTIGGKDKYVWEKWDQKAIKFASYDAMLNKAEISSGGYVRYASSGPTEAELRKKFGWGNNTSFSGGFGNTIASGNNNYNFSLAPGNFDRDNMYLQLVRKA